MHRLTVSIPAQLAEAVKRDARRKRLPVSEVVRQSRAPRFQTSKSQARTLGFAGMGRSSFTHTSVHVEERSPKSGLPRPASSGTRDLRGGRRALYAAADRNDAHHLRSVEALACPGACWSSPRWHWRTLRWKLGSPTNGCESPPWPDSIRTFPGGGVDASVVALGAERVNTPPLAQLDRRRLQAAHPTPCDVFKIVP